ncbi:MAG: hypothetical protein ACWGOX_05645 [Desulforhopalus sp.]
MKKSIITSLTLAMGMVLISSCASENILKSFKSVPPPAEAQTTAAPKVVSDLKTNQNLILELRTQQKVIAELKQQLASAKRNETELSAQVQKLKDEINEKDVLISIQRKVISLLDDSEHTLQKNIEAQFEGR